MDPSLLPFFNPTGVAVIGASASPEKLGYGVARNLIQSGYPGAIHFVGQRQGELFRHPIYTDLSQVPGPVDLAVLIVPPDATQGTIEECGRRGIKAAIVLSSGFREVGPEGAALEQKCLEAARAHGMRILGPNCIGVINTHLPLDTSFLQPPMPAQGHIGFISQSGAFCAAIIDWSRREGFGFSQIVSLGNQADINETDMLAALAEDEHTHVIVLYMESVSDGRRFVKVASEVTRQKPVIALKAGRSEAGQKAAASHTGALAAADIAFDAAFEKAGVLRADSAEQMFDWARALEIYPRGIDTSPVGPNGIAVLTNAGGPGVMAADALERNGLRLASLSAATVEALSAQLPPAASVRNPVDMLASATPETYASCLKLLLDDDHVDGIIVILPPPPMYSVHDVATRIAQVVEFQHAPATKPVAVALMGSTKIEEARSVFERVHIPTYPFPERAASALGALLRRAGLLTTETQIHEDLKSSPWPPDAVAMFSPEELAAAYGIETAPLRLACSAEEAIARANTLGYPVVMKIASPDILHKSDVGGVALNIADTDSLRIAYTQIIERIKEKKPEVRINGVHIQPQLEQGQDVIAGAVRDPQFGPVMMFGSGGVEVEGLKDVAFALAPLTRKEAESMVRKTWAGKKLKGFRHLPPAHEESVIDVLIRLSRLMLDQQTIQEIEINPLRVLANGAIALDVRVRGK
jgi:acetyltransferase